MVDPRRKGRGANEDGGDGYTVGFVVGLNRADTDMDISRGDGVRIDLVAGVDVIVSRYDSVAAASVAVMTSISS